MLLKTVNDIPCGTRDGIRIRIVFMKICNNKVLDNRIERGYLGKIDEFMAKVMSGNNCVSDLEVSKI